jgi:hypothetical protein
MISVSATSDEPVPGCWPEFPLELWAVDWATATVVQRVSATPPSSANGKVEEAM